MTDAVKHEQERDSAEGASIELDLRGLKCPVPAARTRRALSRLPPGTLLESVCTDPLSVIDIPVLVHRLGDELVQQIERDGVFVFKIRKL